MHRSTARRRLDAIVTPDGFFHADFGGAGDCGYRAIAGALALGSGTPLVEVRAQVVGLAASLRAQITSATRSQRLGSDFFAIDPAWTEETEGGPVPTSFDEWVSATARPRRWIDGHGLATAAALLSRRILVWRWADEQWQRVAIFEPPEADPAAVASAMRMPVLPILVKDRHYITLVPTPGTDWPSHWSAPVVRSWQPEFERGGSSWATQLRPARRSACAGSRGVRQPSRLWAGAATYLSRATRPVLLAQCVRGTPPDGDSCGCETDADGQLRASDSLPSLDSLLLGSGDWGGSFGFLNSDGDFCRFLSDAYVLLCSCCCLDALFGIQWSHCCRYLGAELDLLPDAIGCCLRQTSRLWAAAASCLRKAAWRGLLALCGLGARPARCCSPQATCGLEPEGVPVVQAQLLSLSDGLDLLPTARGCRIRQPSRPRAFGDACGLAASLTGVRRPRLRRGPVLLEHLGICTLRPCRVAELPAQPYVLGGTCSSCRVPCGRCVFLGS